MDRHEDIGLLDQYFVTQLLNDCKSPQDSYDLLGGLFTAMNTKGGRKGGRYQSVQYFNGGLFSEPACLELYDDELNQLKQAAKSNWSKVQPEIFGTIFEHSMESNERHAFGANFTSPVDIMKIVGPTIVVHCRDTLGDRKTLESPPGVQSDAIGSDSTARNRSVSPQNRLDLHVRLL